MSGLVAGIRYKRGEFAPAPAENMRRRSGERNAASFGSRAIVRRDTCS